MRGGAAGRAGCAACGVAPVRDPDRDRVGAVWVSFCVFILEKRERLAQLFRAVLAQLFKSYQCHKS